MTVEQLLPCLVEAFNCDQDVHPDLYDNYANLLFTSMDKLIDFLNCSDKETEDAKIGYFGIRNIIV